LHRPGADRRLCVTRRVASLAGSGRTEMPRPRRKEFAMEIRWRWTHAEGRTWDGEMEELQCVSKPYVEYDCLRGANKSSLPFGLHYSPKCCNRDV
jgi:hypothetical protein